MRKELERETLIKKDFKTRRSALFIARASVIAALYCVITLLVYPIAFGPMQFRVSEAMTILPLFFIEAVPGLFAGCFLANIINGPYDMLIGSLASLIAAILTYLFRKKPALGFIPPIVINAFMVPVIFLTMPDIETGYWFNVLTVGIGQILSVLAVGIPLYFTVKKRLKKDFS